MQDIYFRFGRERVDLTKEIRNGAFVPTQFIRNEEVWGQHPSWESTNLMQQLEKEYPVVLGQDIHWGDMDAFGHLNNTVYFRYFEDVRIAYFDKISVNSSKKQFDAGPILARTHCNFRLPLDYPDRIHIAARGRILSPKKFNMEYAVFSEKHGAIAAEGEGLIVYYDYANGKSCEIPAAVVAAIEALEG